MRRVFNYQSGLSLVSALVVRVTSNNAGLSLISVLVALGISSVLALGLSGVMKNQFDALQHVTQRSDLEAIKRMLLTKTSCELTAASCPSSGFIALKDNKGDVYITNSGNGTKIGGWTIRAECNLANDGIVVRAARLTAFGKLNSTETSHFIKDPLTGHLRQWNDEKSLLFPKGTSLCSSGSPALSCTSVSGSAIFTSWASCSSGTTKELFCLTRMTGWTGPPGWNDNRWRKSGSHHAQIGNEYDDVNDRIRCWCFGGGCQSKACARCGN